MNRKDYMEGRCSHSEFYTSVAIAAGLDFSHAPITERARQALAKGDEHLNTIPLKLWDVIGENHVTRSNISRALKEHGDFFSLAGSVCTLKQAVKNAVTATEKP